MDAPFRVAQSVVASMLMGMLHMAQLWTLGHKRSCNFGRLVTDLFDSREDVDLFRYWLLLSRCFVLIRLGHDYRDHAPTYLPQHLKKMWWAGSSDTDKVLGLLSQITRQAFVKHSSCPCTIGGQGALRRHNGRSSGRGAWLAAWP